MGHIPSQNRASKRPHSQAARSVLSVLLSLAMVWSTIPTQALAEAAAEAQDAAAAQQVGQQAVPQEGAATQAGDPEAVATTGETNATESSAAPETTSTETGAPEAPATPAAPVTTGVTTTVVPSTTETTETTAAAPTATDPAAAFPTSDPGADARTDEDGDLAAVAADEPTVRRVMRSNRALAPPASGAQTMDGTTISAVGLKWIDPDTDDENPETDDSLLSVKPQGTDDFTVRMQIDVDLSGQHDYNPGDIAITVPGHVLKNRAGSNEGSLVIPFQEAPSTKYEFNWVFDAETDTYTFYNTRTLSAASSVSIQLGIEGLTPVDIVDMSQSSSITATVHVNTWKGNDLSAPSNHIKFQTNTGETVHDAHKAADDYRITADLSEIPDNIKAAYPKETRFVLVTWHFYAYKDGNTNYTLSWKDTPTDEYGGMVVSGGEGVDTDNDYRSNGTTQYRYATVAYPFSQFEPDTDYTLKNHVDWTLTPTDHDPATTASADATFTFSYPSPAYRAPTGHFWHEKWGYDADDQFTTHWDYGSGMQSWSGAEAGRTNWFGDYTSALNQLAAGQDVTVGYKQYMRGFMLPWTLREGVGVEEAKLEDFGQRWLTLSIEDGDILMGPSAYKGNATKLTPLVDYDLASLVLVRPNIWKAVEYDASNFDPTQIVRDAPGKSVYWGYNQEAYGATYGVGYVRDDDYTHVPDYTVEALVDGTWQKVTTVKWSDGEYKKTVPLPAGTTRYRYSTYTNIPAIADGYSYPQVTLHPTDTVRSMAQEAINTQDIPMLRTFNTDKMTVTQEGETIFTLDADGHDRMDGYSDRIAVVPHKEGKASSQAQVTLDGTVSIHYTLKNEERSNIASEDLYRAAVASGGILSETSGTFYDLLPAGAVPDLSSIKLRDGDSITDVRTVEDYKGSGRTLLVVEARLQNTPQTYKADDSRTLYMDVPTMEFDATYPLEAYDDRGGQLHNVFAFESGNETMGNAENYAGEPDAPTGKNASTNDSTTFADQAERDLMTNLDPATDKPAFAYGGCTTNMAYLKAAVTGVNKLASVDGGASWWTGVGDQELTASTGGRYSYRLSATSSANSRTKGIILYDELERYKPTEDKDDHGDKQWKGKLLSVDVSALKAAGVDAKVYYTTDATVDVADDGKGSGSATPNAEWQLDAGIASGKWSATPPADLSTVTAIAIDCRKATDGSDYILPELSTIAAYVTMLAPRAKDAQDYVNGQAHAYNNVYMNATNIDSKTGTALDTKLIRHDYTKVGLKDAKVVAQKAWDDDDNRDGLRPASLKLWLTANGTKVEGSEKVVTPKADGTWPQVSWDALDATDPATNQTIHYKVEEEQVEGYDLSYTYQKDGSVTLTNRHTPEKIHLTGHKVWVDDDTSVRPTSIQVDIYADGQRVDTKTVEAGSDGSWSFDWVMPKNAGGKAISYELKETGVTTDYAQAVEREGNDWTLTNTYHPFGDLEVTKAVKDGTAATQGQKFPMTVHLKKADGSDYTDQVAYAILAADGSQLESGLTANGATHLIEAGQRLVFRELPKGTQWEVDEENVKGYTADASTIKGAVKPNGQNTAAFTNTYKTSGVASVKATKALTGRKMTRNQFRFMLYDEKDQAVKAGFSDTDGKVTFSALRYGNADDGRTFTYTMREVDAGKPGYTYDKTVYVVRATPHDQGDGTMQVGLSYFEADGVTPLDEGKLPSFDNEYHAKGEAALSAYKTIKGGDLKDKQFSFTLHGQDGAPLPKEATATNDASGRIDFSKIPFTEKDAGKTYTYWATEDAGSDATVTYTTAPVAWTVAVEDKGDGTLGITTTPVKTEGLLDAEGKLSADFKPEALGQAPTFDNSYKPGELDITKTTDGTGDPNQEFTFKVELTGDQVDEDTVKSYEVTNGTDTYGIKNSQAKAQAKADAAGGAEASSTPAVAPQASAVSPHPLAALGQAIAGLFVPAQAQAAPANDGTTIDSPDNIASGTWGTCPWWITKDGVLHVEAGEGAWTRPVNIVSGDHTSSPWEDYASQITAISPPSSGTVLMPKVSGSLFRDFTSLTDISGLASWDATSVEDLQHVFDGCTSLTDLTGISSWDTGSVTNMSSAFNYCTSLTDLSGLSSWDTGSVTDMSYAFSGCSSLADLTGISSWDTGSVTNMSSAFNYCTSLTDLTGISSWDTGRVTDMSYAFRYCTRLTDLSGLSSWDTGRVTRMYETFSGCTSLADLSGLSFWDTGSVTSMYGVFYGCTSLTDLSGLASWDTGSVTDMSFAFSNCTSLTDLSDLASWDTGNAISMKGIFEYCSGLKDLTGMKDWNTAKVMDMSYMFYRCSMSDLSALKDWDTSSLTDAQYAFADILQLKSVDFSGWSIPSGGAEKMFQYSYHISKITFGDKADFNDNSAALALVADSYRGDTGKWVRDDGTNTTDPCTSDELMGLTGDGPATVADRTGTWVKQRIYRTVTFDSNGGSGTMPPQKFISGMYDGGGNLLANAFTRFGFDFSGWNSAPDGAGDFSYKDRDGIRFNIPIVFGKHPNTDITLYAQWTPKSTGITDGRSFEVTIKAGETAKIDDLPANTAYKVWEETPAGWVLVETGNTTGTIKPADVVTASFKNSYQPDKTTAEILGTKTMDQSAEGADGFSFKLEAVTTGAPMPDVAEVTSAQGGGFAFGPITYTAAGTYKYEVSEVAGSQANVKYDTHVEDVTVNVTDDGQGHLSAAVATDADGIAFNNEDTTPKVGSLQIQKTATGGASDKAFTFDVAIDDHGAVTHQTVTVKGTGTATVDNIPDGATYTVTELNVPAGWTLTASEGLTGTIVAGRTSQASLTNTYSAKGTAQIEAKKELSGADLKEGMFEFGLYDGKGTLLQTVTNGYLGDASRIVFDPIEYTAAGIYTYFIKEMPGDDAHQALYQYDKHEAMAKVRVEDDGKGRLTSDVIYFTATDSDHAEPDPNTPCGPRVPDPYASIFVNETRTGQASLTKQVTDGTQATTDKDFTFDVTLSAKGAFPLVITGADGTEVSRASVESGGTVTLKQGQTATIHELPAGTTYSFVERPVQGFTPDEQTSSGTVVADQTDAHTVTNAYATEGSVTLKAKKTYDRQMGSGTFSFVVKDRDGKVVRTASTADAEGNVTFDPIRFTGDDLVDGKPTKLVYTISEVVPDGDDSVEYDTHQEKVVVEIADKGDGTMTATAKYGDDAAADAAGFTNHALVRLPQTGAEGLADVVIGGLALVLASGAAYLRRSRRRKD